MLKIELKGKNYEMPNGWDEVKLGQLLKINEISLLETTEFKKSLKLISLLSGISLDDLYNADMTDLNHIDMGWMSEEIDKNKVDNDIIINGVEYSIVSDIKKLTLGEYADLDEYMKDVVTNLHYVCAVLVRPLKDGVVEKYNSDTLEARAKLFYDTLNVQNMISIANFFQSFVSGS